MSQRSRHLPARKDLAQYATAGVLGAIGLYATATGIAQVLLGP